MNTNSSDVLIVGAGMAGLTAAAYLSKADLRVMLCERGKKTGGLVNSFEHNGFVLDGGIRAIENSGIVLPMLQQLGLELTFLPNPVSVGFDKDVIWVTSKDSLEDYQQLLEKYFPDHKHEVARIIREIGEVMTAMDVQYGIDNPLFQDSFNDPEYLLKTLLPWAFKYMFTMPKISKMDKPVYEYLTRFTDDRALLDMIGQHFFQQTPAFFALSYFSLYLDYGYPLGGTGALPQAMEKFVLDHGGDIRLETEITSLEPEKNQVTDSSGNVYPYRKLVWAADQKTLYRILDKASLSDKTVIRGIAEKEQALEGKVGGDSVYSLYLMTDLDPAYFAAISSPHFFYTPSLAGLSHVKLDELIDADDGQEVKFSDDKPTLMTWVKRYLEHTTFEISIPAVRDSSMAPSGKTALIISTLFDYSLTKHIQSLGWYDEFNQFMSSHMIDILDASIYPRLKAAVMDSFTASPLTIESFSGNAEGAITGWAFTNSVIPAVNKLPKVAQSVLTPIPDTYQAGQWTFSPSGMPISILTGKLAADRVLKELK